MFDEISSAMAQCKIQMAHDYHKPDHDKLVAED